jgi:hypothetical protein
MEAPFVCPVCRSEHDQPANARLGHLVVCLDCAIFDPDLSIIIEIEQIDASLAA